MNRATLHWQWAHTASPADFHHWPKRLMLFSPLLSNQYSVIFSCLLPETTYSQGCSQPSRPPIDVVCRASPDFDSICHAEWEVVDEWCQVHLLPQTIILHNNSRSSAMFLPVYPSPLAYYLAQTPFPELVGCPDARGSRHERRPHRSAAPVACGSVPLNY